jgi:hypothetical protein
MGSANVPPPHPETAALVGETPAAWPWRAPLLPTRQRLVCPPTACARLAGVSRNALIVYERSGRVPKSANLGRIAEAGGSSVDWLLNGRLPLAQSSGGSRVGGGPAKAPRHPARSDPAPDRPRGARGAGSEMKQGRLLLLQGLGLGVAASSLTGLPTVVRKGGGRVVRGVD